MQKNWRQVLVVTDSIGAPRAKPLYTPYSKTWVGLLEDELLNHGYKTFAYTKRAMDSSMLASRMKVELFGYDPEIVIFQIGLCDCAPRALTEFELRIVQKLPIINRLIHLFIKRYYAQISARRGIAYTNKNTFKTNIQNIIDNFKNSKIYFIPIGKPCLGYIKKSPEINERIRCYNNLLLELTSQNKCIYLSDLINSKNNKLEDIYCEDYYHLNFLGHSELSRQISNIIINI